MAKKKAASGFVMAVEIRALLRQNRSLTGKEVYEGLKQKFPSESINENSCGVAFSGARRALKIKSGVRRRKKAAGKKVVLKQLPKAPPRISLSKLQAAAKFVKDVGDVDAAIEAIRQVRTVQIK